MRAKDQATACGRDVGGGTRKKAEEQANRPLLPRWHYRAFRLREHLRARAHAACQSGCGCWRQPPSSRLSISGIFSAVAARHGGAGGSGCFTDSPPLHSTLICLLCSRFMTFWRLAVYGLSSSSCRLAPALPSQLVAGMFLLYRGTTRQHAAGWTILPLPLLCILLLVHTPPCIATSVGPTHCTHHTFYCL